MYDTAMWYLTQAWDIFVHETDVLWYLHDWYILNVM